MTHPTRTILGAALCATLFAPVLQGCGPMNSMVMFVDEKYGGAKYKKALEREKYLVAEHDALQAKYDAHVKEADEYIDTVKPQIEAHIDAGEIGPALVKLSEMDTRLHPTEGYEPRPGFRKVVIHSGRGQRDYIRDAAKRILGRVDDVMAQGTFQRLDSGIAQHTSLLVMDDDTRKGFELKHTELKQKWLAALEQKFEDTRESHPASAMVYGLKARELAYMLDDTTTAKRLSSDLSALTNTLIDAHAFVFSIKDASGELSTQLSKRLREKGWTPYRIKFAGSIDSRTDGALTFTTTSPRYARSKSSTEGSFTYQSGTRTVVNQNYKQLEVNLRGYTNYTDYDPDYADKLRAELAAEPKTLEEPVYDKYTYPITVHEHRGTTSLDVDLTLLEGLEAISKKIPVTALLTDEEHSAHNKNDGSVSADPAEPPTTQNVLAKLYSLTMNELAQSIIDGTKAKQDALLTDLPDAPQDRIDKLAIHAFISPKTASEDAIAQLEELADVNGIADLIAAME